MKNKTTKLLFQVPVATKSILLLFLINCCTYFSCPAYSQDFSTEKDSSLSLLKKQISFSFTESNLADVFQKLTREQDLNISFSESRLRNISVKGSDLKNTSIGEVLSLILQGTYLEYIVIGNVIAIIEKKEFETIKDTLPEKEMPQDSSLVNHIVHGNSFAQELPPWLRKELYKIYRKELRMSSGKDTTEKKESVSNKNIFLAENEEWETILPFVSVGIGAGLNSINKTNSLDLADFNNDVSVTSSVPVSLNGGIFYKGFSFTLGFDYQSWKIQTSITEITSTTTQVTLGNGIGNGNTKTRTIYDTTSSAYTEKYSFLALPLTLNYTVRVKRFFGSAGVHLAFVHVASPNFAPNKGKDFFEYKYPGQGYQETLHKGILEGGFQVAVGYRVSDRMICSGAFRVLKYFQPVYENSFYQLQQSSVRPEFLVTYLITR